MISADIMNRRHVMWGNLRNASPLLAFAICCGCGMMIMPTDVGNLDETHSDCTDSPDTLTCLGGDLNGDQNTFESTNCVGCVPGFCRIERISTDSLGHETDGESSEPSISSDGRFVAFTSRATNLVEGDGSARNEIYLRDRREGKTTRVSTNSFGEQGNGESLGPSISSDGQVVAFVSSSQLGDNDNDDGGRFHIFVRDLSSGVVTQVERSPHGVDPTSRPKLSGNGRFVAFVSDEPGLGGDTDSDENDVFVFDRETESIDLASEDTFGSQGYGTNPSISEDGTIVAYYGGTHLPSTGDWSTHLYVYDRLARFSKRVDLGSSLVEGSEGVYDFALSATGQYLALVPNCCGFPDIVVFDRAANATKPASIDSSGDIPSCGYPSISSDGRFVAFVAPRDIIVRDIVQERTQRLGQFFNSETHVGIYKEAVIADDGLSVAFTSDIDNLVENDTNGVSDIFVVSFCP